MNSAKARLRTEEDDQPDQQAEQQKKEYAPPGHGPRPYRARNGYRNGGSEDVALIRDRRLPRGWTGL